MSSPSSAHARSRGALALALAAWAIAAPAGPPLEQLAGGVEAYVMACASLDPKITKSGTELLERELAQAKQTLEAVRNSPGYKAIYNAEVNRLLAIPAKERLAACRAAW